MKSRLAAVLVGVVLGTTGTALAGTTYYWEERGNTYRCQGSERSVFCKETIWQRNYEVSIIPGWVSVAYGGHAIFGCKRALLPRGNCTYYGP
jgi:hypothetical protein